MKIAITGGCGYLGSVLVSHLAKNPSYQITLLDQTAPVSPLDRWLKKHRVNFVRVDLAHKQQAKALLPSFDYIVHLAALVGYPKCNANPQLAVRNNVDTSRHVMQWKSRHARVLFTSTISNYGSQHAQARIDEQTPLHPTSVYGTTKQQAENIIVQESHNVIFRFAGAFGISPNMRYDNLVHDFTSKAVAAEPVSIYEEHFIRQFIHVDDMARAIHLAISSPSHSISGIYNVGNPKIEITKRQLAQKIAEQTQFNYVFENSGTDLEKRNYPISFDRWQATGFRCEVSLDLGLKQLIEYFHAVQAKQSETKRPQAA